MWEAGGLSRAGGEEEGPREGHEKEDGKGRGRMRGGRGGGEGRERETGGSYFPRLKATSARTVGMITW